VLLVHKGQFRNACILLILVDWSLTAGGSPQRTACEPPPPTVLVPQQGFHRRGENSRNIFFLHLLELSDRLVNLFSVVLRKP
jgi:hypothetical protein